LEVGWEDSLRLVFRMSFTQYPLTTSDKIATAASGTTEYVISP
jgi:hypothetical protein